MVKPPFMEIACPVCSKPVKTLEYYPRSLCPECSARVTDRSGRPVVFYDIQALPTPNSSGITLNATWRILRILRQYRAARNLFQFNLLR